MAESKAVIETYKGSVKGNFNEENWRKFVQARVVCAQRGDIFRHKVFSSKQQRNKSGICTGPIAYWMPMEFKQE